MTAVFGFSGVGSDLPSSAVPHQDADLQLADLLGDELSSWRVSFQGTQAEFLVFCSARLHDRLVRQVACTLPLEVYRQLSSPVAEDRQAFSLAALSMFRDLCCALALSLGMQADGRLSPLGVARLQDLVSSAFPGRSVTVVSLADVRNVPQSELLASGVAGLFCEYPLRAFPQDDDACLELLRGVVDALRMFPLVLPGSV